MIANRDDSSSPSGNTSEQRPRVLGIAVPRAVASRLTRLSEQCNWEYAEISAPAAAAAGVPPEPNVVIAPQAEQQTLRQLFSGDSAIPVPTLLLLPAGAREQAGGGLLAADAYVSETADDSALAAAIRNLLSARDTAEFAIRRLDPNFQRLTRDETTEWFRSRLGILGVTRIPNAKEALDFRSRLGHSIRKAYSLLDELSEEQLSLEDLWNLLLFIAVPWTQAEAEGQPPILTALDEKARDTSGSRKLILWKGLSLLHYLGPMGKRGTIWLPSSPDPLRDALAVAVTDPAERDALEALFKARVSETDLDRIVKLLGKDPA